MEINSLMVASASDTKEMLEMYSDEKIRLGPKHPKGGEVSLEKSNSVDMLIATFTHKAVEGLPYCIDSQNKEEFKNLNLINIGPNNPTTRIFKEFPNIYAAMVDWRDSRKNAILIQLCNILQRMLTGEFVYVPNPAFENMTFTVVEVEGNEYNKCFSEIFRKLPDYYQRMIAETDIEKRKQCLDSIFAEMRETIGQRFSKKSSGTWTPYMDLRMLLDTYGIRVEDLGETYFYNQKLDSLLNSNPNVNVDLNQELLPYTNGPQ